MYHSNGKSFQLFKVLDARKYYALHFEYSSETLNAVNEETDNLEASVLDIPGMLTT
ncbi:MAG: hypothetical protein ABI203_02925 [Mucilaginibacter sp.]